MLALNMLAALALERTGVKSACSELGPVSLSSGSGLLLVPPEAALAAARPVGPPEECPPLPGQDHAQPRVYQSHVSPVLSHLVWAWTWGMGMGAGVQNPHLLRTPKAHIAPHSTMGKLLYAALRIPDIAPLAVVHVVDGP